MTRDEAERIIIETTPTSPVYARDLVSIFKKLGMLKLDENLPPEKTAMCKAFSNYENTYRHREARSGMPEREAMLILRELENLGFKVVKA